MVAAESQTPTTQTTHKHMRHPFLTELLRSIGSTLTRFLAIMSIVGLGVGFYAGLNMTGKDMRQAADIYYDNTRLYDLRVISTMGLTDSQLDVIRGAQGVSQVVGGYATDAMMLLNGDRYVTRVASCDFDAAADSTVDATGALVVSDDESYLNRLVLVEGSWPKSEDECVLCVDCVVNQPTKPGDTVELLYGTGELDDVFAVRKFTVTGLVHSPQYPSNVMVGYSTLGTGMIQQCLFVNDEAFSDELPYTEVYVTVDGALELPGDSDAYQARVDEVAERIEGLGLGALRYDEVVSAAEKELAEAQTEYDENEAEARSELEDAYNKLADAYVQLEDAKEALLSGKEQYDDGVKQLEDARAQVEEQLANARKQLEDGQRQLEDAEKQLGMSQADIDAARRELESGAATWNSTRSELVDIRADLRDIRSAIDRLAVYAKLDRLPTEDEAEDIRAQFRTVIAAMQDLESSDLIDTSSDAMIEQAIDLLEGALNDYASIDYTQEPAEVYEDIREVAPATAVKIDAIIDDYVGQIDDGIKQGDSTIANTRDLLDQAQSARDQIDAGWRELEDGWAQYRDAEAKANDQLDAAQKTLDDAAQQLIDAAGQYQEGRDEFNEGYATYIENRDEAIAAFADAAEQLAAARADIDSLEEPSIYVFDRSMSPGVEAYKDDTYRMDSIASVFPFIFFLVAALVSLTTMTRMVEDERAEIGTHKALGFSTARITAKYVAYAGIAGLVGSAIGIFFLSQILPWVVQVSYGIMYAVPALPFPQPIDPIISVTSTAMGLGVTFLAIFAAAAATLREAPATLMLPRAPKAGKRILLERVGVIWSRLSFSWKVTCRNLFRYKQRFVMTVVGVAGCTALLLTGFGLHNSIWDIIEYQNEGPDHIALYNLTVGLDAGVTAKDTKDIEAVLAEVGGASEFEYFDHENLQVTSAGTSDAKSIQVHIVSDSEAFAKMVNLRERETKHAIEFTPTSVVMTEKMANTLGIGVGDEFTLYEQDEIGNPTGDGYRFTLTDICENYVFHFLYVGDEAWKSATGEPAAIDSIFTFVNNDEAVHKELVDALADIDAVASTGFIEETINTYRTSLKAVNIVVVVLVAAAAILAFIVLYNLINIQLIERTREIASLKVLGFNRREVSGYLFRETIILVLIGALVGLVLGTFMEGFVVVTAEVDAVMFGRDIHLLSYFYSFGLTIVFSLLVMAFIMPKLHSIDMVESLKSVD